MERQEDSLRQALQRIRQRKSGIEHTAGPSRGTHNTNTTTTPSQRSQLHSGWGKEKWQFKEDKIIKSAESSWT